MADEEIKIIRQVRHEISAECGHDVDRVVAYYRRVEEELKRSGRFRFAGCPVRLEPTQEVIGGPSVPAMRSQEPPVATPGTGHGVHVTP